MIKMSLKLMPKRSRQDLAWLAHTTSDLTEIYDFLLHAQLEADAADEISALTESELRAVADTRAARVGTPLVQASEGSMILQLSQFLDATIGVQVLAAFGLLLKKGPDIAAFPHKLQQRWYSSAEDALRARNAYKRLERESFIGVDESPLSHDSAVEQLPHLSSAYVDEEEEMYEETEVREPWEAEDDEPADESDEPEEEEAERPDGRRRKATRSLTSPARRQGRTRT